MAQTSYYTVQKCPGGHRLITQVGRHQFAAGAKTATLTLGFNKVVAAHATVGTNLLANLTALMGLPVIPASQITQQLDRTIYVSRKTTPATAANFDYAVYGY
jgi:hypothetical protein